MIAVIQKLKDISPGHYVEIIVPPEYGVKNKIRQITRHSETGARKTRVVTLNGFKGKYPDDTPCIDLGADLGEVLKGRWAEGNHDFDEGPKGPREERK